MVACGFAPNRVTIINLIKGLCTEGRVEETYKLLLNHQSFQNKSFWLPRDAGCLTDGEMGYDGSSKIEQKRAHQWFLDSSEPELFCNKKQAIEAVKQQNTVRNFKCQHFFMGEHFKFSINLCTVY
ncbi:hypothetical protein F0562_025207 [Nyssa sinensis]|uniref:Uncharacterized protein n=1 Tax=Nyssa sinensis TaxID=561372 RepID=A0A5J5BEW7_9ASTE|nr:hypothetical protein F0562_025207 [Nyssa sinensis]